MTHDPHQNDDAFGSLLRGRARDGFIGRRAHRLVFFIESQVAHHKEQLLWACRLLLGEATKVRKTQDVLGGFVLRDHPRERIEPTDLERLAPQWSRLVPAAPRMRAAVIHILARKYRLAGYPIPRIRKALSLDSGDVQAAYASEYGSELESALQSDTPSPAFDPAADDAPAALLARSVEWRFIQGGEVVTRAGEAMDTLYVVASGRLRTDSGSTAGRREFAVGDVLGDVSVLAESRWTATVRAARDSEVVCVSKAAMTAFLETHPRTGIRLTQALVARSASQSTQDRSGALTLAIVPLSESRRLARFGEQLAACLKKRGSAIVLDAPQVDNAVTAGASAAEPGDDLDGMVAGWLSEQESHHRFVIYQADPNITAWTERCVRQADRIILVAHASSDPGHRPIEARLARRTGVHLALVHSEETSQPSGTAAWLAHRDVVSHHHIRLGHTPDLERAGRLITGEGVGLVLGGGGARGFVHTGVLRALYEQGVQLDLIGGTSMGAIGAGLAAIGWSPDRILSVGDGIQKRGALLDYTLPILSLAASRRLTALLQSVFGDLRIEDLWQPFFCVSSNLSRGRFEVHRAGPMWEAVRASVAIPGVFSPVMLGGEVLVDGAVLNNLPLDVMREMCPDGTLIAVQVSPSSDFGTYDFTPTLSGWQILWRRLNPFLPTPSVPSILGILMRSFEVKGWTDSQQENRLSKADILIQPDTSAFRLLDFSAYHELDRVGYEAATQALGETDALSAR